MATSDQTRHCAVTVRLKPEVLDPEGRAILTTLQRLGYDKLKNVRIAKRYELEFVADDADLPAMSERIAAQLLANPVAEVYQIETER